MFLLRHEQLVDIPFGCPISISQKDSYEVETNQKGRPCRHRMIVWVTVIVFSATYNNISVISWRSVLLAKETGIPGDNHRPAASH